MRRGLRHLVETIRSLVDRIEVSPGLERGRCEVIIVGALARIHENTTAASAGDGGTFLMVAGPDEHYAGLSSRFASATGGSF